MTAQINWLSGDIILGPTLLMFYHHTDIPHLAMFIRIDAGDLTQSPLSSVGVIFKKQISTTIIFLWLWCHVYLINDVGK